MTTTKEKSTAKHTPEPWVARGDIVVAHRPHVCGGYNEESVLSLNRPSAERHANKRLIAAAPSLLAACKLVSETCGPAEFWNGETNRFLKLVEKAIAKAEGGSNE